MSFRIFAKCGAGFTLCLLLFACGGAWISVSIVDFDDITPPFDTSISDRRLVVARDYRTWDQLWREHTRNYSPPPAMPVVDFSRQMVVGIFAGADMRGCPSVSIYSIKQISHPDRIEVAYRFSPSPAVCPAIIRPPYALAVIPYSTLPVEFVQLSGDL